jgi:hypothetical protein
MHEADSFMHRVSMLLALNCIISYLLHGFNKQATVALL